MNDSNNNSSKLLVIALILAAVAGLAYYMLSEKPEKGAETPAVTTEQSATPTEPTQTEAEKNAAVLETKTLKMPAGAAPTIPTSEASKDPAVEAMMAPRTLGSNDAPIKVVEYASLTCGHCGAFHKSDFPKIKAEYIDTGKVQFTFKEFPLNKPAIDASKLLRCMPEDRFVSFMTLLFEEQEKWAYQQDYLTALKQDAKLAGLSDEQATSCLNNKDLENRIIGDMKAASEAYKIQSTPTFIINNGEKTIVGHQPVTFFEETFNGLLGSAAPAPKAEAPAAAAPPTEELKQEAPKEEPKE